MSEKRGELTGRQEVQKAPETQEGKFEILADRESRKLLWDRVNRMVDGVARMRGEPPTLLFLDKSARPISWMFRARWKHRFPDVKIPDIRYAGIGRRQIFELDNDFVELHRDLGGILITETGPSGGKYLREFYGSPMQVVSASDSQAAFTKRKFFETAKGHGLLEEYESRVEELASRYHDLDGRQVIVVDDYSTEGTTQLLAEFLLQDALPTAVVNGVHLFSSNEKDAMPWLQMQGMAGVVEFAEQEDFLVTPLTRESFTRVRGEVRDRLDAYEHEDLQRQIQRYRKDLDVVGEAIAKTADEKYATVRSTISRIRELLSKAEKITDQVKRAQAYRAVEGAAFDFANQFRTIKVEIRELWNFQSPVLWVDRNYLLAAEMLASFVSFEEVKAQSSALRSELTALAKLEADQL